MRRTKSTSESGAVIVMVAVWLPVLMIFVSFAVDFAHFFDYSRNLQNRADAAAMAAAVEYGGTCSSGPTVAQTDAIGQVAQRYAGPPNGTPSTNLPFLFSSATPYQNQPNLSKGTPANFHMLLNSNQSWPSGTNWSMGTPAANSTSSKALCSSRDEDGNVGPIVDVRLTQANLGLFFPSIFGSLSPNINAHARAALEGEASTNSAPIAVGDTGFTPCVSVRLIDPSTSPATVQTIALTQEPSDPLNPTAPVQWDNAASPASYTMPASANVIVQPFLSDCNGNGQTFDDTTNTGLLLINNHPASAPAVNPGSAPRLNTAGVTVSGPAPSGCANGTQYLSVGGCQVTVNAGVTFASDVNANSKANVSVIEHYWNNTTNSWQTAPAVSLKPPGPPNCPLTAWCGDPPKLSNGNVPNIDDTSGIAQFEITWSETDGTVGAVNCKNTPNDPACSGTFGIQAQAFGACNGCDQPDDSGPVVFARVSQVNGAVITNDLNTYAGGSTQNLVFTIKLSGLNTAGPTDPPTVLRFSASTNHQTGLIDCGQGNGKDTEVVYYGCGPGNPLFNPPLNPLFVNKRNTCGNPAGPPWPGGNQQDCVQTTPGQRRNNIICPLVERIVGAPYGGNCNNQAQGTCPTNNWLKGQGSAGIPTGDRRAVQMIITSDVDLAAANNSPQFWIPIRKFATFYVTGWDTSINPPCTGNGPSDPTRNESYPVKGKRNAQNGSVWGHWINYEDTAGTPNGQLCVLSNSPTNCVPALTR